MTAILGKELREHAKWAAIALVPTVAMAGVGVPHDETLVISGLIAAAIAFCFGLLQTVLEVRQNQWAFLIHRAVSPSRIFWAKSIIGICLYLLVTGGPLLVVSATYSAIGIERMPWHWTMVMPRVALIVAGAGFYWAGMLVAQRQARWYGSRVMPLALPALCQLVAVLWVTIVNPFGSVGLFAFILGIDAVVAIAAWGIFVNSGETRGQPVAGTWALGAGLFTAICGIVLTGLAVPLAIIAETVSNLDAAGELPEFNSYRVDREGNVWLFRWGWSTWAQAPHALSATRMDDTARSLTADEIDATWQELPMHHFRYRRWLFGQPAEMTQYYMYAEGSPARWSFLPAYGLFVGYGTARDERGLSVTRLERWAGPDGFFPASEKPTTRFGRYHNILWNYHWDRQEVETGSMRLNRHIMLFSDGVYLIDFVRETVTPLHSATGSDPIRAVSVSYEAGNTELTVAHAHTLRIFRTEEQVVGTMQSIAWEGKERKETELKGHVPTALDRMVRLPGEATCFPGYRVGWVRDRDVYVLLFESDLPPPLDFTRLVEMKSDGTVLSCRDLPEPNVPGVSVVACDVFAGVTPLGIALPLLAFDAARQWSCGTGPPIVARMVRDETGRGQRVLAILLLSALASCFLTFMLGKRRGLIGRARLTWAAVNILLGPAGVLLFLAQCERPVRVTCLACRRPRVVSRETCEHCAEPFRPPNMTGIELFERPVLAHAPTTSMRVVT